MTQTVKTIPVELTELRAASTAGGGTALTTTLGLIPILFGADYMSITPRNFVGCAVARVALNPYLRIFHTQDAGGHVVDISDEMQDGDAVSVALAAFAIAGTGYMYVGATLPFRGAKVTLGTNKNGAASVITVRYWNGGAWADTDDTDGTISPAGTSMGKTGDITWTVPAAWAKKSLVAIGDTLPAGCDKFTEKYWTRWEWSAALDSVDVDGIQALNRSTAYAEYLEGQAVNFKVSNREIASVEALTNAGTANLVVNVGALVGSELE